MAYRIACANGNYTTAATWATVDATSLLDSQANTFVAATAATWSQGANVAPGIITIDGIAVKVAARVASPSGTFSVRLYNVTGAAAVAGTTVTVNVSDIQTSGSTGTSTFDGCAIGWVFFKFAAPVTLAAATNYRVEAQSSAATQVTLYRDATASNMSRMLRTTTTGAPAASDSMFVLGEWTAAATVTARAVTMDQTAATDYGGGSTSLASLGIGDRGTLTYGTTAATNYVLRLSGVMQVWLGGTFTIGTVADPIPRTGSAVLEFDCATTSDFGLVVFGTFTAQGLSRTSGKNVVYALLTADVVATNTVITLDRDTGWLNGDDVVLTGTSRTRTDAEVITLNGAATATQITASAGIAADHGGTTPIQAEAALLSRNVQIRSTLSTAGTYCCTYLASTLDIDWVLFRYVFGAAQKCFTFNNTSSAFRLDYCCFRDCANSTTMLTIWTSSGATTLTNCVFFCAVTPTNMVNVTSTATGIVTWTDCVFAIDNAGAGQMFTVSATTSLATMTRIYVSGGNSSLFNLTDSATSALVIDSCAFHGSGATAYGGLNITSRMGTVTITNTNVFHNNSAGAGVGGFLVGGEIGRLLISDCKIIGNQNINIGIMCNWSNIVVRNSIIAGTTAYATGRGIVHTTPHAMRLRVENSSVGVATGIYAAHTSADFGTAGGAAGTPSLDEIICVNSTLGSATETEATFTAVQCSDAFIARQRKDGTTATHERVYWALGTISYETGTFRTAAPSEKLAPNVLISGAKLKSAVKRAAVAAGQTVAVSVYVQTSVAYAGAAPRLIVKANPALGIDTDTVLDTMAGGASVWEQLTGTTSPAAEEDGVLEFYVDCDGVAGAVYVDDWAATLA